MSCFLTGRVAFWDSTLSGRFPISDGSAVSFWGIWSESVLSPGVFKSNAITHIHLADSISSAHGFFLILITWGPLTSICFIGWQESPGTRAILGPSIVCCVWAECKEGTLKSLWPSRFGNKGNTDWWHWWYLFLLWWWGGKKNETHMENLEIKFSTLFF